MSKYQDRITDAANKQASEQIMTYVKTLIENKMRIVAQECYLACLAVESGEGECARAIATQFPDLIIRISGKIVNGGDTKPYRD